MPRKHNITIARSGVQYYLRNELPKLGLLSIPDEFAHFRVFGVYRPSYVVEDSAPMFKGAPIVIGHTHWLMGPEDEKRYGIGRVGDEISVRMIKGEATVKGICTFVDDSLVRNSELSAGYKGEFDWSEGVAPGGEAYQIVARKLTTVNHVACVPKARGGAELRVLDGGPVMAIASGLLRTARQLVLGVTDCAMTRTAFRNTLNDAVENRVSWTDQEWAEHQLTLETLAKDLPDSEEKSKLYRFIADLPLIKSESQEVAEQVAKILGDLFEQLDTDAIEDVIGDGEGEEMPEPVEKKEEKPETAVSSEEKKTETPPDPNTSAGTDVSTAPVSQETVVSPKENTEEEATPERALNMLKNMYEFLGKMFSSDIPADPSPPAQEPVVKDDAAPAVAAEENHEAEETPEKEAKEEHEASESPSEEKKEEAQKVGDAQPEMAIATPLPLFSQKVGTGVTANSLDTLFASLKSRRR